MTRIGAALLIFVGLFSVGQSVYLELSSILPSFVGPKASYIVCELLYAGLYLASFMVPVAFFALFSKKRHTEPMRLSLRLTVETPLFIFASVGIILASAVLNSLILEPIISPEFNYSDAFQSADYSENYKIVIQFIATAIVPGVCEEFLFRGMILSNLMPYGKNGAIIVSSLLFGLMHQNPLQMFYATMAGIVLALLYIYTRSIYCSMLVHIVNNGISVLEEALSARLPESDQWIITVIDVSIFVLAAVSVVILLLGRKRRFSETPDFSEGVFGKTLPETEGYQRFPVHPLRKIRLFFAPTIIIFLVVAAIQMAYIMVLLTVGTSWLEVLT